MSLINGETSAVNLNTIPLAIALPLSFESLKKFHL